MCSERTAVLESGGRARARHWPSLSLPCDAGDSDVQWAVTRRVRTGLAKRRTLHKQAHWAERPLRDLLVRGHRRRTCSAQDMSASNRIRRTHCTYREAALAAGHKLGFVPFCTHGGCPSRGRQLRHDGDIREEGACRRLRVYVGVSLARDALLNERGARFELVCAAFEVRGGRGGQQVILLGSR